MFRFLFFFLLLNTFSINAQLLDSSSVTDKASLVEVAPSKILLTGGSEGGGGSGGGKDGSSKVIVASSDYDLYLISNGVDCASSIGAQLPENKSVDNISKAIEEKISVIKPSRSIASETPQSCAIFSSQTSSVILKRKFLRDEIVFPSKIQEQQKTDSLISK